MYNEPNAPIFAYIEMNMQGEKATRFVENFNRMAPIQYKFDHGQERTILVFAKGPENLEIAKTAGATLMGGPEIVKDIQNGDLHLAEYQYIVAHTNMLADLLPIRGLMKKKFPYPKNGTLGTDLKEMITNFMNGIQYSAMKDEHQKNFGTITTKIGTLDMDPTHLEANLVAVLKDIDTMRPKRDGKFITRVLLKSPPSSEQLKIDPFVYVPEGKVAKKSAKVEEKQEANDDVDEPQAREAVN